METTGAASFVAANSQAAAANVFASSLLNVIPPVTNEEILQAFLSTTDAVVDSEDTVASLAASMRSMNFQNNVMFRMIIHSGILQRNSGGRMNGRCRLLKCDLHASRRFVVVNFFVFDFIW
jgi:hypothetical protein